MSECKEAEERERDRGDRHTTQWGWEGSGAIRAAVLSSVRTHQRLSLKSILGSRRQRVPLLHVSVTSTEQALRRD